ncbi:MAG: hypothetical protein Kow0092_00830 [Deferrisomatales bacterium]
MDKLLTIKEAAELLNVSEMSLRRWTNAGKLKCYRVGKKRERRFRIADLQSFLRGGGNERALLSGLTAPVEAHIAHFYGSEEDCLDRGIAYVKQGLDEGELVLVMSPEERRGKLLRGLEEQGVLVPVLEDQGILTVFEGMESAEKQASFVDRMIGRSQPFKGFRLLGDMVWTQERGWDLEELYRLEKLTNCQRTGVNGMFFCQYDKGRFSADAAFMAMQTHNFTLYHDKLNPSPYFDLAHGWTPSG